MAIFDPNGLPNAIRTQSIVVQMVSPSDLSDAVNETIERLVSEGHRIVGISDPAVYFEPPQWATGKSFTCVLISYVDAAAWT